MRINCFSIDSSGRARSAERAEVVASQRRGGDIAWIDVVVGTRLEANELMGELGLDAELIDRFLEVGHAARVISFDDGLFFELPLEITGQPAELKSALFVCLDRLLLTVHREPHDPRSWVDTGDPSQLDLGDGTVGSLVGGLLVELSLGLRRRTLEVRRTLSELADQLDSDDHADPIDLIAALKRAIFDLDAISEEREAALESLRSDDRFLRAPPDAADQLAIALGNTAATARRLDRFDRRVEALQTRIDSAEQEKINRRLSRLTIISAIFLPLTLIAGIYGMNFEVMPELGFRYAYPLTLVGMVVITLGLLWWFKRGGWMD